MLLRLLGDCTGVKDVCLIAVVQEPALGIEPDEFLCHLAQVNNVPDVVALVNGTAHFAFWRVGLALAHLSLRAVRIHEDDFVSDRSRQGCDGNGTPQRVEFSK